MPLYIRDDEVNALAEELRRAIGVASKTDAVRTALVNELELKRTERAKPSVLRQFQSSVDSQGFRSGASEAYKQINGDRR